MRKTKVIVFCGILLFSINVSAQKNAIKTNFTGFLTGDYSLGYERAVNEKQSITFKAGYLKPTLSPFINSTTITPEVFKIIDADGGANFSAEYRFYMNGRALNGLYIAPYARFFSQKNVYTDEISNNQFNVDTRINNFGLGAQLGYQLQLSEQVHIDFFFFGAGLDKYRLKLDYRLKTPVAGFDYNSITDDISDVFSDINYLEKRLEFKVTSQNHVTRLPFLFPGFRLGVNFGFCF